MADGDEPEVLAVERIGMANSQRKDGEPPKKQRPGDATPAIAF